MATVPPNVNDGRSLGYQFVQKHTPLEVLVTYNPNDSTVQTGWGGATDIYYGGIPYNADDSVDSRVIPVAGRKNHAFQVSSAQMTSFSVQLEGSIDGQNFVSVGSAVTSVGITQVTSGLYKFLRFNATMTTNVTDNTAPYGLRIVYISTAD